MDWPWSCLKISLNKPHRFQTLVVIGGFVCTYLLCQLTLSDWGEHPFVTNVEMRPITEVQFPTVTVCQDPLQEPDKWALVRSIIVRLFMYIPRSIAVKSKTASKWYNTLIIYLYLAYNNCNTCIFLLDKDGRKSHQVRVLRKRGVSQLQWDGGHQVFIYCLLHLT